MTSHKRCDMLNGWGPEPCHRPAAYLVTRIGPGLTRDSPNIPYQQLMCAQHTAKMRQGIRVAGQTINDLIAIRTLADQP